MNVQLTKDDPEVAEPRTGPHLPTVAWGLTLVAVAVLVVLREVTEWSVDIGLVVAAGMVVMGALLLVTALVTLLRQGRRPDDPPAP